MLTRNSLKKALFKARFANDIFQIKIASSPNYKKNATIQENTCRYILEYICNKPFPSVRPTFLKNPATGYNLELDGYNEELKLGFEYNGHQHYLFPSKYITRPHDFIRMQERDLLKQKLCTQHNVKLIIIPYTIEINQMYDFIVDQLLELGVDVN
jgi:hypothetical protein